MFDDIPSLEINTMTRPAVRAAIAAKGTRFATVRFYKKDGTERTINGLFRPLSHIKGTGRQTPPDLIAIWSPSAGWRSFSIDSVISIT